MKGILHAAANEGAWPYYGWVFVVFCAFFVVFCVLCWNMRYFLHNHVPSLEMHIYNMHWIYDFNHWIYLRNAISNALNFAMHKLVRQHPAKQRALEHSNRTNAMQIRPMSWKLWVWWLQSLQIQLLLAGILRFCMVLLTSRWVFESFSLGPASYFVKR